MAKKYSADEAAKKAAKQYASVTVEDIDFRDLKEEDKKKLAREKVRQNTAVKKMGGTIVKNEQVKTRALEKASADYDRRAREVEAALNRTPITLDEDEWTLDGAVDAFEDAVYGGEVDEARALDTLIQSLLSSSPNTRDTRAARGRYLAVRKRYIDMYVSDRVKRGVKRFGALVGKASDMTIGAAGRALAPVGRGIGRVAGVGGAMMQRIQQSAPYQVGGYFARRISDTAGLAAQLGRATGAKAHDVYKWLGEQVKSMKYSLMSFLHRARSAASGAGRGAESLLGMGVIMSQLLAPLLSGIDKALTEKFGEHYIRDFIDSAITTVKDAIVGKLKDLGEGVWEWVKEKADAIWSDIKRRFGPEPVVTKEEVKSSIEKARVELQKTNPKKMGAQEALRQRDVDAYLRVLADPKEDAATKESARQAIQGHIDAGVKLNTNTVSQLKKYNFDTSKLTVNQPAPTASQAPMEAAPPAAKKPVPTSSSAGPVSDASGNTTGGGLTASNIPNHAGPEGLLIVNAGVQM